MNAPLRCVDANVGGLDAGGKSAKGIAAQAMKNPHHLEEDVNYQWLDEMPPAAGAILRY